MSGDLIHVLRVVYHIAAVLVNVGGGEEWIRQRIVVVGWRSRRLERSAGPKNCNRVLDKVKADNLTARCITRASGQWIAARTVAMYPSLRVSQSAEL